MSPLLSASKPGYFTDVKFADANYVPISKDTQLDFELDPWVHISLGEVIRGRIGVDDAVCSHWGYGSTVCQRFAVTAPASGTLGDRRLGADWGVLHHGTRRGAPCHVHLFTAGWSEAG